MKINSLEQFVNYLKNNIMKNDYERHISMSFGDKEILIFVFETEIPIRVNIQKVYCEEDNRVIEKEVVVAEVFAELLRVNIGKGWLTQLDTICSLIEEHSDIFVKLLREED